LSRWESDSLSQAEAAELPGMSEQTLRRWARQFEGEGEAGLLDRRLGRWSGRAVPQDRATQVAQLYQERYAGFTVKHFREHLVRNRGFSWVYTWTKTFLQNRGLVAKAARRGGAPTQAAAPAAREDDATSGWLAAQLAGGMSAAGPDRHAG
jgi:transposase